MKLIAFTINELWGDKHISFKLNEDVNIISGINGSGKTTILDILYSIINNDAQNEQCCHKYTSAQLSFTDDYVLDVVTENERKVVSCTQKGITVPLEEFRPRLNYACISSFDYAPFSAEIKRKLEEKYSWVQSELDYGLAYALDSYYMYIVYMSKQVQNAIAQKTSNTQLAKYYSAMTNMQDICDSLFAPSLKWDRDSSKVQFLLTNYNNKIITPHDLSAGEKQMLVILINTLTQNEQECVAFWDEPELSLHVDWQKILISTMQKINPNMQLIVATHSPFILYDGWENRVVNIKNLIK